MKGISEKNQMRQKNKQFYAKLIVFICILIVGLVLIQFDTAENFGYTGRGYLTTIVVLFICLGALLLLHGLIVLLRSERQKEKTPEKVRRNRLILIAVFIILIIIIVGIFI